MTDPSPALTVSTTASKLQEIERPDHKLNHIKNTIFAPSLQSHVLKTFLIVLIKIVTTLRNSFLIQDMKKKRRERRTGKGLYQKKEISLYLESVSSEGHTRHSYALSILLHFYLASKINSQLFLGKSTSAVGCY